MCPQLTVFGRSIPAYGLMGVLGGLLALAVILLRCRRDAARRENAVYICVMGMVGGLIGAKLLYLLTVLPDFIADLPLLWQQTDVFVARYLSGGLVFYGGLIGGALGAWLTARAYRVRLSEYYDALLPAFALFSACGRVGCFLAGCCYGCPVSRPFGVVFPAGSAAPAGVPLLPVQLIEAAFDLLLFAFMLVFTRRAARRSCALYLYVLLYAAMRFVLEFFRGDALRGIWWGLSTSQWISLGLAGAAAVLLFLQRRRRAARS